MTPQAPPFPWLAGAPSLTRSKDSFRLPAELAHACHDGRLTAQTVLGMRPTRRTAPSARKAGPERLPRCFAQERLRLRGHGFDRAVLYATETPCSFMCEPHRSVHSGLVVSSLFGLGATEILTLITPLPRLIRPEGPFRSEHRGRSGDPQMQASGAAHMMVGHDASDSEAWHIRTMQICELPD
jgi:hypothetical protein